MSPPSAPLPQLPQSPGAPPVFGMSPVGQKPGAKTPTPSYLNAAMSPSKGQTAQKTLVGQ
jgi:hypothetical protein